MGIMIGCPHLLQGTVPRGCKSPGMNTFVSHQLHVTMRSCSLMPEANLPPPRHSTSFQNQHLPGQKLFDKRSKMVSLSAVEYENHDGFNSEAYAGRWSHVHLAAQLLWFWRRGKQ
jgi:hypothetical protein